MATMARTTAFERCAPTIVRTLAAVSLYLVFSDSVCLAYFLGESSVVLPILGLLAVMPGMPIAANENRVFTSRYDKSRHLQS